MTFTCSTSSRRLGRVSRVRIAVVGTALLGGALIIGAGFIDAKPSDSPKLATPSRSTTIALTSDEQRLVVVNREANSISVIQVRAEATKNGEMGPSTSPRSWPRSPSDSSPAAWRCTRTTGEAYVTNGISGTVSVVSLRKFGVVAHDPRGHRAARLRADAGRAASLCGEPYGGHRLHHQHRFAEGRWDRARRAQSHRHCDHEQGHRQRRGRNSLRHPDLCRTRPQLHRPHSTAMVRRAISGNGGSSTPSRRAMPIRRSPRSPSSPLADSGFTPAARTFARAATRPTRLTRSSSARTRPCLELIPSTPTTRRGCSPTNSCRR